MTEAERRLAAREFAADWEGRGDEKQETQAFWMALLQKVYGVAEPEKYIEFEVRVKLDHTSFIDGLIKPTRVLIEQKSFDIDLLKGYKQSDSSVLTPFQQARRYAGYLPHDQNPRWIVVCNFQEFHIHDMNRPNDAPEIVRLKIWKRNIPVSTSLWTQATKTSSVKWKFPFRLVNWSVSSTMLSRSSIRIPKANPHSRA